MDLAEQRREDRARAASLELVVEQRRLAETRNSVAGPITIDPDLAPAAARLALEILVEQISGLGSLVERADQAGRLRAAVQMLRQFGHGEAATRAWEKFEQVWASFNEIDPAFMSSGSKAAQHLATIADLYRQSSGAGDIQAQG